jgi:ATP-dependent protease HslVU (ClpYQ) peptidase subunit
MFILSAAGFVLVNAFLSIFPLPTVATTICAVSFPGGVVLGADSRSTGGSLVMNKEVAKIRQLSPDCALAGAGVSAQCSAVARAVARELGLEAIELSAHSSSTDPIIHSSQFVISLVRKHLLAHSGGESVFIFGRRDGLFLINSDGAHERISFGSFGSGYS